MFHSPDMGRRAFLKSATGCLALPGLVSLWPRALRAGAPAAVPQRMALFHAPCGFNMSTLTPAQVGSDYALSPILSPLAALKGDILPITGAENRAARLGMEQDAASGRHSLGLATLYTGAKLPENTPSPQVFTSLDQIFAKSTQGQTPVSSLQLGIRIHGDCDNAFPCVYITCMSWADANTPMPPQTDPQHVFDTYFAGAQGAAAQAEQAQRRQMRKSVLDGAVAQATALSQRLGSADRAKLDQYLTSVRAVETQLTALPQAACQAGTPPGSIDPYDYQRGYQAMMDLMVLAFHCDLTRTLSFSFGPGHCDHLYNFLPGINDVHHSISHHNGDPNLLAKLTTINTWEMSIFGRFLQGLKNIPEGDGSMLDNTFAALSSELSDGAAHNFSPIPLILAGGAGGMVTGRHIKVGGDTFVDTAAIFLAVLQGMGVPANSFGEYAVTTPFPELTRA